MSDTDRPGNPSRGARDLERAGWKSEFGQHSQWSGGSRLIWQHPKGGKFHPYLVALEMLAQEEATRQPENP